MSASPQVRQAAETNELQSSLKRISCATSSDCTELSGNHVGFCDLEPFFALFMLHLIETRNSAII